MTPHSAGCSFLLRERWEVTPFEARQYGRLSGGVMNDRIAMDPNIQHGKPVIRGTRVPVVRIIGGLAGGMGFEDVQEAYGVGREDILAALDFASELIAQHEFYALPT